MAYFKILIPNFSRGIQGNNEKPVRIFGVAGEIRTVCLPNTNKKSYIWKQWLNQVAQVKSPSIQIPTIELRHRPVDFSSVHNLTIITCPSYPHSNLTTGLLHKSFPNTSLHIQRVLQRTSIPKLFIWPS